MFAIQVNSDTIPYIALIINNIIIDKRAVSISIESGIQNGTLAITIAVVLLGESELAIAPAIYSLLMFFTGGAAIYYGLRRARLASD